MWWGGVVLCWYFDWGMIQPQHAKLQYFLLKKEKKRKTNVGQSNVN
jgi:hypothetical protein